MLFFPRPAAFLVKIVAFARVFAGPDAIYVLRTDLVDGKKIGSGVGGWLQIRPLAGEKAD